MTHRPYLIENADVEVLNAARTILERLVKDAYMPNTEPTTTHDAICLGRFAQAADVAATAVFETLNVANAYLGAQMTHEQLHNVKEETAA